ncbi:C-terminal binding protein [Aeoliella sp. ICT_H6.2]|uniref:C-terminal binding protein n=1 Tax=Aeoliella straminimaris TaxID=2954799 RepID=A0A9X2JKR8_9BACT|nr:C-terminal binding protein [Aeoliella straminimaris]MCO6047219.1 C-terminal binding protein [Aeoliella straminimaris]
MPRALYTDFPWPDTSLEESMLATVNCELVAAPTGDEETLARLAVDCDTIITCWAPVTAKVLEAATNCRHVARTGIGLDNIDVTRATELGMVVTNVPDYCIPEVAEHTLALMFALSRSIHVYHQHSQAGKYDIQVGTPMERMEDQTVGIIGLGQIGKLFAEKCQALGMRVLGNNRSQQVPEGVEWRPLNELLAESDYVVLLCPLTEETQNLMSHEQFALMKPTAFLINTSRGGLVDHGALAQALDEGQLAGAGLDVQVPEPPDMNQAPYNDPKVIVTPHAAFLSTRAVEELRSRVARQVVDFLEGKTPENIVNAAG